MDISKLWPRVVKLEAELLRDGKTLSRRQIKRRFKTTENTARFIYEALKNRKIISGSGNVSTEVSTRDTLKKRTTELREARAEIKKLMRRVEVFADLSEQRLDPPRALIPGIAKKGSGIATVLNSDTHFDEYVAPDEIGYVNGYSREIANARIDKFFDSIIKLSRDYFSGIDITALVFAMGGDMVSGIIHDELAATNCYPISETVLHYSELYASKLKMLLEYFKELYVPCVIGNHGRFGSRIKFKAAVQDNWDYLFYNMIARELRNEKHIRFYIPTSPDAYYPVFDTRYCLTHGNQFRGGSGWMGPLGPVMRGDTRKKERQQSVSSPYDVLMCAHYHTLRFLGSCIMNGSMVGYNEFASAGNFGFENPQQAFWITDPEWGVTMTAPIHCKSDNESWELERKSTEGFRGDWVEPQYGSG